MSSIQQMLAAYGASGTTWNPADCTAGLVFSNGNLTVTAPATAAAYFVRGTKAIIGKKYFEYTLGSSPASVSEGIGIANAAYALVAMSAPGAADANSSSYVSNAASSNSLNANSASTSGVTSYNSGIVVGVAVDQPNHLVYFSRNGVYQLSGNPAAGTGGLDYVTTSPIFPLWWVRQSGGAHTGTLNVGATAFTTAPPTGYTALG